MTRGARLPPHVDAARVRRPAALRAGRHRGRGRVGCRGRLPLGDHGLHRGVCRVAGTARRSPRVREGGRADGSLCAASDSARGARSWQVLAGGRRRRAWSGRARPRTGSCSSSKRSTATCPGCPGRSPTPTPRTPPASSWPRSTRLASRASPTPPWPATWAVTRPRWPASRSSRAARGPGRTAYLPAARAGARAGAARRAGRAGPGRRPAGAQRPAPGQHARHARGPRAAGRLELGDARPGLVRLRGPAAADGRTTGWTSSG